MADTPRTTAKAALALAMAKARTSPPEYATVTSCDKKMAERVIRMLEKDGWKISR